MTAVLAPRRYKVHQLTSAAVVRAVAIGLEGLRSMPPMSLSEWATEHFILAGESSQVRGGWVAWPFQVGIMDMMSDDDIEELDVFKAKRIGYTKMLTASIGFDAAYRRRNQALWQPTDDDRDSFVKSEVEPVLDGVPAVRNARRLSKGVEDTIKYKQFRGSVAHMLGGKAARAYRRITVASAKLDEIDAFDRRVEKSADPVTLARGRLEGAAFPKLIVGGTPRIKGQSHVEDRAQIADADLRYHIVCPHCSVEHPLLWGGPKVAHGMKWDGRDPSTVRHHCPHCLEPITQAEYLSNWVGSWVCSRTGLRLGPDKRWRDDSGRPVKAPRHVVVRPWAAYSPQRDWVDIVREFLAAHDKLKTGDDGPMQGFVNETLGETWELRTDSVDEGDLASRERLHAIRTVPRGCLVLVAGVDVQDNRFEIVVWGFGRGEEMWCIDYQVLNANPADDADWAKLDDYLRSRFAQVGRQHSLGIEAVAIDSGGHFTHQVYGFVRQRERRRFFAVAGSRFDGKPIKGRASKKDVNWRGEIIKAGVKLWEVGTDTAKDLLHGRLQIVRPGPGCINFPTGLPAEFFKQLTAEGRLLQRTATGDRYRWVKRPGFTRNEVLDCTVYALFAAMMLDLHRYTDAMWDKLQRLVEPEADLFIDAEPKQPATAEVIIARALVVTPAVEERASGADQVPVDLPPLRSVPMHPGGGGAHLAVATVQVRRGAPLSKRQDIVAELLEAVAAALASEGTFTEQVALQIEQQFRAKYGGERVGVWKTSTGQVGRPPRQPYDQAAAFADGASAEPTPAVTKKHGISRATLYRLMKRGPSE